MHTKSLALLSIIFCLFLVTSSAQAQDKALKTDTTNYQTFNLYIINGYAISYDMIKNNNSTIRVHLDFSGSLTDINSDRTQINSGQPNQSSTIGQKNSSFSVALSFYYLHTFYNSDLGEVYAGIGPGFGYSKQSYSSDQSYIQTSTNSNQSSNNVTKDYSLGFTFVLGLKSYITKSLSVFAESQISGGKRWEKNENSYSYNYNSSGGNTYTQSTTNTDGNGWFYDAQFIRLGISVSL